MPAVLRSPRRTVDLRPFAFAALFGLLAGPAFAEDVPGASDLLQRANAAFAAERMVAPPGDNALEFTLAARELDPNSERVREGINDLYPLVVAAIERDLRAGREAEAMRVIALLERAVPNSLAARQFRTRIDRRVGTPAPASVGTIALNR